MVRRQLAEDRTDWAMHRTLLAKERTFSAWLRTALAAIATGLAIARLLEHLETPLATRTLGTLLVVAAGIIIVLAFWRYRHGYKEMKEEGIPVLNSLVLVVLMVVLLAGVGLSLFLIFYP